MKKSKVLLISYVNGNFGDDLFVKVICDRYEKHNFYMSGSAKFKGNYVEMKNLRYISNDTLIIKIISKIYNTYRYIFGFPIVYRDKFLQRVMSKFLKTSILISGSYFIETETRLKELEMEKKWYDNHPFLIGCNFGPYATEKFRITSMNYFKKAMHICFRDKSSYDIFPELNNTSYAPDVVYTLSKETIKKDYIVISVMDFQTVDYGNWKDFAEEYINKIVTIVDYFSMKKIRVVFISFCDEHDDDIAIKKILEKIKYPQMVSDEYYSKLGINETLKLISECSKIIATRFHSLVLAIAFNKEVLPIMYSMKMENMLLDLNLHYKKMYVDNFVNMSLENILDSFIDTKSIDLEELRLKSNKHFEEIDKQLNPF